MDLPIKSTRSIAPPATTPKERAHKRLRAPQATALTPTRRLLLLGAVAIMHLGAAAWLLRPGQPCVDLPLAPGAITVSLIDAEHAAKPAAPEPVIKPKPLPMRAQPTPAIPAPPPVPPTNTDAPAMPRNEAAPRAAQVDAASSRAQGPADAAVVAGVQTTATAPSFDAEYLSNPAPAYPPQSRQLREQGRVLLRVHVNEEGLADQVHLYESSGYARLDQAALEVVTRWRFVPAQDAGRAVAGWVVVPIRFSLRR